MKRVFSLLLGFMMIMSLLACSGGAASIELDVPPPWSPTASTASAYEKSVYEISKTRADGTVVASGTLTFVLDFDHRGETNNYAYSSLTSEMSITYNESADEIDRGKTDTISSKSVFQSDTLSPLRAEKQVVLADRTGRTNAGYTLSVDYESRSSELTRVTGDPSTLEFADKSFLGVYDNEVVYFALRANATLGYGASGTFSLANFFAMHNSNRYFNYSMRFSCSTEDAKETLFLTQFGGTFLDAQGSAEALTVELSINDTLSGPPIELKYSLTPFKVGESLSTRKVLLSIKTTEYNVAMSQIAYETTYSLTDYSVTKPEN